MPGSSLLTGSSRALPKPAWRLSSPAGEHAKVKLSAKGVQHAVCCQAAPCQGELQAPAPQRREATSPCRQRCSWCAGALSGQSWESRRDPGGPRASSWQCTHPRGQQSAHSGAAPSVPAVAIEHVNHRSPWAALWLDPQPQDRQCVHRGSAQGACCQGDPCISQGSGLLRSIAAVLRVYNLCTAAAVCLMQCKCVLASSVATGDLGTEQPSFTVGRAQHGENTLALLARRTARSKSPACLLPHVRPVVGQACDLCPQVGATSQPAPCSKSVCR